MELHYDITIDHIMTSEGIMASHNIYHDSVIAIMKLVCCSWTYSYIVILKYKYSNIHMPPPPPSKLSDITTQITRLR